MPGASRDDSFADDARPVVHAHPRPLEHWFVPLLTKATWLSSSIPLDEVASALKEMLRRRTVGKIVMEI